MTELRDEVLNLTDVDMDDLNIYDPNASNDVTPQSVVKFSLNGSESATAFIVKSVGPDRVLLELSEDISLEIQNMKPLDNEESEDMTQEDLRRGRLMREFDSTAVQLGLISPELTPEQIDTLPINVVRKLSDVITSNTVDAEA